MSAAATDRHPCHDQAVIDRFSSTSTTDSITYLHLVNIKRVAYAA